MIFISILILIVARAINSCNINLSSIFFIRITSIIFIYAGILSLNILYIQSIGSGIGIYSGLFQVTSISQYFEIFLLLIGSIILVVWPLFVPSSLLFDGRREGQLQVEIKNYTTNNNVLSVEQIKNTKIMKLM